MNMVRNDNLTSKDKSPPAKQDPLYQGGFKKKKNVDEEFIEFEFYKRITGKN